MTERDELFRTETFGKIPSDDAALAVHCKLRFGNMHQDEMHPLIVTRVVLSCRHAPCRLEKDGGATNLMCLRENQHFYPLGAPGRGLRRFLVKQNEIISKKGIDYSN